MYISMNDPAKIMLYERIGSAAGPNTVAKYTQRRIDGVSSATPYREKKNIETLISGEYFGYWSSFRANHLPLQPK